MWTNPCRRLPKRLSLCHCCRWYVWYGRASSYIRMQQTSLSDRRHTCALEIEVQCECIPASIPPIRLLMPYRTGDCISWRQLRPDWAVLSSVCTSPYRSLGLEIIVVQGRVSRPRRNGGRTQRTVCTCSYSTHVYSPWCRDRGAYKRLAVLWTILLCRPLYLCRLGWMDWA